MHRIRVPNPPRSNLAVEPHLNAAKPPVLCCHPENINENIVGLVTTIPPLAKLL